MIDRAFIEYLKDAHGLFNTLVMLAFLYQGWLGLTIRNGRKRGNTAPFSTIKRHRKLGPLVVLLGLTGFLAGLTIVYIDQGRIFKYPLHFSVGACIALALVSTYIISKRIRIGEPWRKPHLLMGILLLCLYIAQVLIGADVLF